MGRTYVKIVIEEYHIEGTYPDFVTKFKVIVSGHPSFRKVERFNTDTEAFQYVSKLCSDPDNILKLEGVHQ